MAVRKYSLLIGVFIFTVEMIPTGPDPLRQTEAGSDKRQEMEKACFAIVFCFMKNETNLTTFYKIFWFIISGLMVGEPKAIKNQK